MVAFTACLIEGAKIKSRLIVVMGYQKLRIEKTFMCSGLLDSQLTRLEPFNDCEPLFTVDINQSVGDIVKEVTARVL